MGGEGARRRRVWRGAQNSSVCEKPNGGPAGGKKQGGCQRRVGKGGQGTGAWGPCLERRMGGRGSRAREGHGRKAAGGAVSLLWCTLTTQQENVETQGAGREKGPYPAAITAVLPSGTCLKGLLGAFDAVCHRGVRSAAAAASAGCFSSGASACRHSRASCPCHSP